MEKKVIKMKHIVEPTGFGAYSSTCYYNKMEKMCQCHGSNQTPTPLCESKTHDSINSYAAEEFLVSIISNSEILLSLQ